METENIEVKAEPNPLHTVTPVSKYLAMALFIVMPFIGGWIGYVYAPEKVVEVERVVMKEISVVESEIHNDQNDTKESNSKPLLSTIRVENDTAEIVQMTWSVREEVRSLFPMNDTYVIFSIIPDGMSYEGLDVSGVVGIGDGFKLSQTAYEFNPLNYKALAYEAGVVSQIPLEQNKSYQVVATLKYQPSSFTCKPGMGKDCIPVYSDEDLALVEMAKEYMSVSVPTRMK